MPCYIEWSRLMGFCIDGQWPPCYNKSAISGGSWQGDVWAGILGSEIVGLFRVHQGVKMTSSKHMEFLTDHFLPWYKKKNRTLWKKIVFKHHPMVQKIPLTPWLLWI